MELAFEAGNWWSYVLVFLGGATPVLEVLVVIPAGVLAGMPAGPTAFVAIAGNLSTVVLVVLAGERLLGWWRRRRPAKAGAPNRRADRARDLARRWGIPGLALLAPLTTGTHIAAVAALATGAGTRRVLVWMAAGLGVWGVTVAIATSYGIDLFG